MMRPGVFTHDIYDAADQLKCVLNDKTAASPSTCSSATMVSKFEYTLDAVGNRKQMLDTGVNTYVYDALYRLKQVTYPNPAPGTDTYTYDTNGNRLTKNATIYTYDYADQMKTAGGVAYQYDNNGNQTSAPSSTFTYDHENRLTVVSGSNASTNTYNGDGLRMSRTASGVTTNYTWDVASGLPSVLEDGTNRYVYGLDLISATNASGAQTYFLYDGLGSTTELVNGTNGSTLASYRYDTFGAIRSQTGTSANYWLFTGEQRDSGSNLYYLRARYYDPGIGRFLSQDPLPTGNLYAYVGSNPVNFIDPSGLHCKAWHPHHCVQGGADVAVDVLEETAGVVVHSAAAAASEATVEQIASSMQIISGAMIWMACGPQDAVPGAGQVAFGICISAVSWYGAATAVKYMLADSACERQVVLGTAVLGLLPPFKYIGNVLASFSSGVEALGCPTTAHASGVYAGSKE